MTRADLPDGVQLCQVAHAALDFALAFPTLLAQWHTQSNTVVVLTARDELDLVRCHADAVTAGLRTVAFHEPDLGGALTALALEPAAHRRLAHLPLAFAQREEVNDTHVH